jgi:hypothetical protein
MSGDFLNSDVADHLHGDLLVERLTDSDNIKVRGDLEKEGRLYEVPKTVAESFSTASLGLLTEPRWRTSQDHSPTFSSAQLAVGTFAMFRVLRCDRLGTGGGMARLQRTLTPMSAPLAIAALRSIKTGKASGVFLAAA